MNFHECSWVFTVFYQGFDHGQCAVYRWSPQAASVLHCSWKQGTLPILLLWQTNDTSAAPKPDLRTDSYLTVYAGGWCQSFLHVPPVLTHPRSDPQRIHFSVIEATAVHSANSCETLRLEDERITSQWRWGWLEVIGDDVHDCKCQFLSRWSIHANFCRVFHSQIDFVATFCGSCFCLFHHLKGHFKKSWKNQKCPFPCPVRMQGPFPPQPTRHVSWQLDSVEQPSTYNLTDLTAECLRGKTRRSPEIRHGDSSQLFSCFTVFFVDMFGWIAWSRKNT